MTHRPILRASYFALLGALGLLPVAACGDDVEEPSFSCTDSQPVLTNGAESGYETCSEGYMHRASAATCSSALPRADFTCEGNFPENDSCNTDADCTEEANGYCGTDNFGDGSCYCRYGCTTDSDCGDGRVCLCGEPIGRCVTADCAVDADCPGDSLCTTYITEPGCGGLAFACQTADDECATDADCDSSEQCTLGNDGARDCEQISCAIGRPFLVEGLERLAEQSARSDWQQERQIWVDDLDERDRRALAAHWTNVGLMEHASIAAFARFALQLMAQGAPAELIELCNEAMRDETAHAKTAFGLASAYADAPIGPGPLSMEGAFDDQDMATVLRLVVREGCIGETVAAVEASVAARHATDPAVREVLLTIAQDEHRHAELAWKYVDWLLGAHADNAELLATLHDEIESAAIDASVPHTVRDGDGRLLEHGAVGETMRRQIRCEAIAEVVGPCAQRLAGRHRRGSTRKTA